MASVVQFLQCKQMEYKKLPILPLFHAPVQIAQQVEENDEIEQNNGDNCDFTTYQYAQELLEHLPRVADKVQVHSHKQLADFAVKFPNCDNFIVTDIEQPRKKMQFASTSPKLQITN